MLKQISELELMKSNLKYKFSPNKSIRYFINRYLKSKFYVYRVFGFYVNGNIIGAFIARVIKQSHSRCMRIVDWIGAMPKNAHNAFQELLAKEYCEYIDLLCYVPNEIDILEMGFSLKDTNKDIVIPNYFEPFVRENVNIRYAYKSNSDNYAIFKGDSDQDRPNVILK